MNTNERDSEHSDAGNDVSDPAEFYCAAGYCPETSVGYLMKRVLLSIVLQVDRRIDVHSLTSAQWGPLMRLQTAGASTAAELARWLSVDAGAMTRLLDRLERKGLCKRVRSTEDRRAVQVELTPAGETAIRQVPAVLADVLNGHLAGFSADEWHALRDYLERMLKAGEAMRRSGPAERSTGGHEQAEREQVERSR